MEGSLAHEDSQELKEYRLKYMIPTELLIVNRNQYLQTLLMPLPCKLHLSLLLYVMQYQKEQIKLKSVKAKY